jgi:Tfp pilus assembly protein PilO
MKAIRSYRFSFIGSMLATFTPLMLVMGLSISMAVGVYWLLVDHARARLASAEAVYQSARQLKVQLEETRRIQERAKSVQTELARIWGTLPTQEEFATLALAVSELGRADGVTIPGMRYSLKPEKERAVAVEATLVFQAIGAYPSIYRFIHHLEHHSTYMVIDELNVQRVEQSLKSAPNQVLFNVTLKTFLRPALPSAGV